MRIINFIFLYIHPAIPFLHHWYAPFFGHKIKEIGFSLLPQLIHINTCGQLMHRRPIHIKTCHQRIVNPLNQRIIHEPDGQWQIAQSTFVHRGTVKMTKNRKHRRVALFCSAPDCRIIWFLISIMGGVIIPSLLDKFRRFFSVFPGKYRFSKLLVILFFQRHL